MSHPALPDHLRDIIDEANEGLDSGAKDRRAYVSMLALNVAFICASVGGNEATARALEDAAKKIRALDTELAPSTILVQSHPAA